LSSSFSEFPICPFDLRIVRFSFPRYNEFATGAGPPCEIGGVPTAKEQVFPAHVAGLDTETRRLGGIVKITLSVIVVKDVGIIGEVGLKKVKMAVEG
jgi:hypothetical protein